MSDFTLILLVNGRENFTKRWLEYMSLINFKHKIVIGNGNKKKDYLLKKIINHTRYSKLKIEYHSYNNKNYKDYYFMMYDLVKNYLKTEFLRFCDNDDFILKKQQDNLINFFKKNKKYLSVGDFQIRFEILDKNKLYEIKNIIFLKVFIEKKKNLMKKQ